MYARKRIDRIVDCTNDLLRNAVGSAIRSPKERGVALNDIHLIEAALVTDQTVVSLDETARQVFSSTSEEVVTLREIAWINPSREEERPIPWLRSGAKPEEGRRLGSH